MNGNRTKVTKSDLIFHLVFFMYAGLVILRKAYEFRDGVLDATILLIFIMFLILRPFRLINALGMLSSELFFKIFGLFLAYFMLLSFFSYNNVYLIALELLSVFKWTIYFCVGYLFGLVYRPRYTRFPLKSDVVIFVSLVLVYSVSNYNWSGIGSISSFFSYYENSFESLFQLRSVFALFGFMIFVYAINLFDQNKKVAIYLLAASSVFMFMSGNRKVIIIFLLTLLFVTTSGKHRVLIKSFRLLIVGAIVAMGMQTALYDKSLQEYSDPNQPRILAYSVSFQIARDYFPFGSGPATFASRGSIENYSPLYTTYGLKNVYGFGKNDEEHYYNDTYWAQIISQYGAIGTIIVLCLLYQLRKRSVTYQSRVRSSYLILAISIVSIVTPALQRIEVGLFVFFGAGLYASAALLYNKEYNSRKDRSGGVVVRTEGQA